MAEQKILNARLCQKIDTEENWNKAVNFIPLKGEIIIYENQIKDPKSKNLFHFPVNETISGEYEDSEEYGTADAPWNYTTEGSKIMLNNPRGDELIGFPDIEFDLKEILRDIDPNKELTISFTLFEGPDNFINIYLNEESIRGNVTFKLSEIDNAKLKFISTYDNHEIGIQIEEGTAATEYEDYIKPTVTRKIKIGDGITKVRDLEFISDDVLRYIKQDLTEEQQTQARENISAVSLKEVEELLGIEEEFSETGDPLILNLEKEKEIEVISKISR